AALPIFSLISGNADFKPRLSVPDTNFVPGGSVLHGFLTVTAPATATVGQTVGFRVQVASEGSPLIDFADLTATVVAASNLRVVGVPASVLIDQRGIDEPFQVKVTDLLARTGPVVVSVDAATLPPGWTMANTTRTVTMTATGAVANFTIRAPATELGVSRVPLRFTAAKGTTETGFSDIVFDLTSIAALSISAPDGASGVATAGSDFVYSLRVKNNGTGNDLVTLSATGVPTGWTASFNPAQTTLGPLEEQVVDMTVKAPQSATPRTIAPIVVFATGSSGAVAQKLITTTIGYLELSVNRTSDATAFAAPGETASFVLNVTNTGTLTGDISVKLALVNKAFATHLTGEDPALLEDVRPGESRDVLIRAELGSAPPTGVRMPFTASAKFVSAAAPIAEEATMTVEVLNYVATDADRDGITEYAVDRDRLANGYEAFAESGSDSGKQSASLVMSRYMSNASLEKFLVDVPDADGNITQQVVYMLDGDADGRTDHFLDSNGDLLPDVYWDPDSRVVSALNTSKDINGDDIPEFFVDRDGDGALDGAYDLDKGTWTLLRKMDVDGDGTLDYLVDNDGDGQVDADETVLYSKGGKLLTVQKIDLDGDGKLDSVFDVDGDGRADYFIVSGSDTSIPIVYRDVTGDKVLDWTFDLDGDGTEESYYNPATGESQLVDQKGLFWDAVKEHWYIGALFALVLVLFVALIGVTRRG
ncbi:MAG: hypothetical protein WC876_12235, partial [Candidatus Thermoplasmatota archaeon]